MCIRDSLAEDGHQAASCSGGPRERKKRARRTRGRPQAAGIVKHASVHTLRHSFATHMLLKGVNIREVQKYLGHESVETTMIYYVNPRHGFHRRKPPG